MLFPDGLGYDFQNKRVQTFRVNSIFSAIASISDGLTKNKKGNFQNNFENSLSVTSTGLQTTKHLYLDTSLFIEILLVKTT